MNLNKNYLFIYFLIFASFNCKAQTTDIPSVTNKKIESLRPVIITATRTKKDLSEVSVPTTLISEEEINASGTARLNEILNEQTGVVMVSDESGFEGIQIQGLDSDYVLILIDGVPLIGRSSGNFDLSRLTVGNIKQVEIIRGPSSSLYGSEALGGVVNIITKKKTNTNFSGNASYQIARFNQQDLSVDFGQKLKKLTYSTFINRYQNDGYDLNNEISGNTVDPFTNYTINTNLNYQFSKKFEINTITRLFKQNSDAVLYNEDIKYSSDSKTNEIGVSLNMKHTLSHKTTLFYDTYFTEYKTEETFKNPNIEAVFYESDFKRDLVRPEIRSVINFTPSSILSLGLGYQYDFLDRTLFEDEVSFNSQYVFAQYDFTLNKIVNIVAGARFDNHSEYENQLSPKLALNIKPIKGISIKPSVGYGFKAPDFRQLYLDFTNPSAGYSVFGYNVAALQLQELIALNQISNPENILLNQFNEPLKAESSIGYNLGISYEYKKLTTNINFFYNDIQNLIDTQAIAQKTNGSNVFSYRNYTNIITKGLEFDTSLKISNNLNLGLGYQLLFAYDKDILDKIDNEVLYIRDPITNESIEANSIEYFGLPNRSRHNANLKLKYKLLATKTQANLRLLYRSKYALFDDNNNGFLDQYDESYIDPYYLVNLTLKQEISEQLNAQIGAKNLLNYKDRNIPTLPGIQPFIKLNYKF